MSNIPSATTISASQVAAEGSTPRHIQFPSPIYFTEWVTDSHVLVGAGGGGHRFGMANVVALLAVRVPRVQRRAANHSSSSPPLSPSSSSQPLEWAVDGALDLGDRIPWLCTAFEPVSNLEATPPPSPTAASRTMLGYFAVSHMDSFSVIRVVAASVSATLQLEDVCVIPLHTDLNNPDKKPISHCALPVPQTSSASSSSPAAAGNRCLFVAGQDDGHLKAVVLSIDNEAFNGGPSSDAKSILATAPPLDVGCRVNDVTTTTMLGSTPSRAAKTVAVVTVVVALQDKTLRVYSLEYRHHPSNQLVWHSVAKFDGNALGFPFPLMKSSLKFVNFINSSECMVIAYDAMSGWSWITTGKTKPLPVQNNKNDENAPQSTLVFSEVPFQCIRDGITCYSPISSCATTTEAAAAAAAATTVGEECSPLGWIFGTVEGSIFLLQDTTSSPSSSSTAGAVPQKRWKLIAQRPDATGGASSSGSFLLASLFRGGASAAARRRNNVPLHKEPVSSVSLSPNGIAFVSTDIAQTLVLSTFPSASSSSSGEASSSSPTASSWTLFPAMASNTFFGMAHTSEQQASASGVVGKKQISITIEDSSLTLFSVSSFFVLIAYVVALLYAVVFLGHALPIVFD